MTSYNKINGVHTANSHDLLTRTAREQWGFDGVIMTDWTTTNMDGGASSVMYYQGEQNTIVSTLYGARNMPNCWLVAPES